MYGKYTAQPTPPSSPVPPGTMTQAQRQASDPPSPRSQARHTATAKRHKYLRRIFKFKQMDFEYAFWQMLYLFIAPQKVYRNFAYRKHTKDQWARDDPAFLVLLSFWLCASSIVFALVLGLSPLGFLKLLLWVVFIDCIGVGLLIATVFWYVMNKYLIIQPPRGQDLEWGYAFDVHLNALFPLIMILHFFQLPFISLINNDLYIASLIGNTFWLFALGYYIYITFLGYSSLPFLKKSQVLLYPMTVLFLLYMITVSFGWNMTKGLIFLYKVRSN